jgi:hypothetical protein
MATAVFKLSAFLPKALAKDRENIRLSTKEKTADRITGKARLSPLFWMIRLRDSKFKFKRFQCIFHQHGNGHRANTSGNRSDPAGNLFGSIKVDIST